VFSGAVKYNCHVSVRFKAKFSDLAPNWCCSHLRVDLKVFSVLCRCPKDRTTRLVRPSVRPFAPLCVPLLHGRTSHSKTKKIRRTTNICVNFPQTKSNMYVNLSVQKIKDHQTSKIETRRQVHLHRVCDICRYNTELHCHRKYSACKESLDKNVLQNICACLIISHALARKCCGAKYR